MEYRVRHIEERLADVEKRIAELERERNPIPPFQIPTWPYPYGPIYDQHWYGHPYGPIVTTSGG